MPQAPNQFSGIFISYRRDDSAGHAGRLFDRLTAHFGDDQIFMDIDHIEPGEDFVQVIEEAVGSCEILIAVIGQRWLASTDGTSRRLDNPNDFVRLEIAAALNRDIHVIPVLVHGASMSGAQDLPDDLAGLARRNAFEVSDLRWKRDVDRLIRTLERILTKQREVQREEAKEKRRRHVASAVNRAPVRRRTRPVVSKPQNITNRIGMKFVWIPPGSFTMGSKNGLSDEKPVHRVKIGKGFYIGKYEVTQAQWLKVMGRNPSEFRGDNLPVEWVSWAAAQEFIQRLNTQNDGYVYRLPSEAEWEYACRAGTKGNYAGDLNSMAWYDENAGDKTHPVGRKRPNRFGLYDMHGNVEEWCMDYYHENYNGAPADGSAWLSGENLRDCRVLRGGSWYHYAIFCRSADRSYSNGSQAYTGLRIVAVTRQ
jgi:formylglycine-generating enzyme required for sulfatase activity